MMATLDHNLYQELRSRYPEVPETIVTCHMQQLHNDRDKCMETLASESPKYLFGSQPSGNSSGMSDHVINRFRGDCGISEQRGRSDSSSSNMSNASSCSSSNINDNNNSSSNAGTPTRQPYTSSHSLLTPGSRIPVSFTEQELNYPSTAPVMHSDLTRFLYSTQGTSDAIPSISCNSFEPGLGYSVGGNNYSQAESQPMASQQPQQPQPPLRQIKVQHMKTQDKKEVAVSNPPPISQNSMYEIRLELPGGGTGVISHPSRPLTLTPVHSNSNPGWVHHPVNANYTNMPYASGSSAFSHDPRNVGVAQHVRQSPSPVHTPQYHGGDEPNYLSGMYIPGPGGGSPFSGSAGQHSSQATIFLQNPTSANNMYNAGEMPGHSPGTYLQQGSQFRDPRMSPGSYMMSPTSPSQQQHQLVSQLPQQGYNKPGVEIKSPVSERVHSQIEYFNKLAAAKASHVSSIGLPGGAGGGMSNVPSSYPQTSYVDRLNTPERPSTAIDIQGPKTSQDEVGFMQFPHMPNVCRVPGHPHGLVHNVSSDNDSGGRAMFNVNQGHRPYHISPASSQSSLSSESSQREPQRPRSGSLQDDPAYTQALLLHQRSRIEKLAEDLKIAEARLGDLKQEVTLLEGEAIEKKRKRNNSFPSSSDLAGLRSDNLQLQADIQLMTREIDLLNNGQTPLGVLDPLEQQNFYKTMNTGQRGSIYAPGHGPRVISPTPTSATSDPSAPVQAPDDSMMRRLPPAIPPQLPPRDFPPPLPPRTHPGPPPPPPQQAVNSGDSDADGESWNCSACTFLNHPALNKCECCEMPRLNTSFSPPLDQDVPDRMPTYISHSTPSPQP